MHNTRSSLLRLAAIVALLVGTLAATASATTQPSAFDAKFQDRPCGQGNLCGNGTITGFGRVKSELALGAAAAPAPGCFYGKGARTVTLVNDANSTLRLAVQGTACGARAWGTFKVVSGTGAFAGAKGSGVIWGAPTSLRYFGVLTLSK
jgi:hypothetical protein